MKLSIIVAAYCQEKYIEQAIRSILMQKVNFEYEVLIGEDFSPDRTAEVLRRIENDLPEYFHIFYRKQNLGEQANNADLQSRSVGQYIIFLEGDDYWTKENKLQQQVDFLDTHPEYIAVAHQTYVVGKDGTLRTDYIYPECHKAEYTLKEFREDILSGQTATLMFRNFFRDKSIPPLNLDSYYPGDQQKNFLLALWGKVFCIQKKMSAYRYVPEDGTSYSATHAADLEWRKRQLHALEQMYDYALLQNIPKEKQILSETIYMRCLVYATRDRLDEQCTLTGFVRRFMTCKFRLKTFVYLANLGKNSIYKKITGKKGRRI